MSLQTVDADSFKRSVLEASIPVIVLFSDISKNSSKKMIASLEAAAEDHGAALLVLNKAFEKDGSIEKNPDYDVQSAPTTLLFKDGKLVRTVVGFYNYSDVFKAWVDELANG
ncbi:co-chaperone YbbN [Pseudomonas sp. LG1E9]|uniref:thioredoxin family protein n=1 Tax=Pseudomonas sp. LG1E9 TaxID=2219057 RepID=UPI0013A6B7CD|nr:thioredoxin family protein [Pseudomonas sp. LG1E9]